jgi:hypothetical protein
MDKPERAVAKWLSPRLRLGTSLIVIALIAAGLSWETDRRRREVQESAARRLRDLQIVAEGRKQRGEEHRLRAIALEARAEDIRQFVEREQFRDVSSRDRRYKLYSAEGLALTRRQVDWERLMADNARWAAEHPDRPWPDAPPYPEMVAKLAPSRKPAAPPTKDGPYTVPRIVKKPN